MELLQLFSFLAVIILALLVLVCHISSQMFFLYILLYWAINSPAIIFLKIIHDIIHRLNEKG